MVWQDKVIEETGMFNYAEARKIVEENAYHYKFPRPSVTTDIVILKDNGIKPPAEVLLIKRANEPFKDCWAIVGGFLDENETLLDCAKRELEEETGIRVPNLTPIGVYDDPKRDTRGRVITHVYGYISRSKIVPIAGDDAKEAKFFPINSLPNLAFDHKTILEDAIRIML